MGCHVSGVFFCLSLLILITNVFDIMIEKETHRMSRQENEKNPQPKAEKTDNAAPLESRIHLLTIIGEVEGHESLGDRTKSTKYEEILPRLALIEDDDQIEGILILLHTVGGDVEAGLALSELVAGISKPTVSLVIGGGHSIGIPLAVSADYSFVARSATMTLHPIRTSGTLITAEPTFEYMKKTQERVVDFIAAHSHAAREKIEEKMNCTSNIANDVGTLLFGEDAVQMGLIDSIGSLSEALEKLRNLIKEKN